MNYNNIINYISSYFIFTMQFIANCHIVITYL